MQIWNMKMKMAVIKVIYEAPQSHLWRRHDSLVSFMCGRPSSRWQASLPSGPPFSRSLCRGGLRWLIARTTYTPAFVHTWFILLIKMCDQSPLLAATTSDDAPTLKNFERCCRLCHSSLPRLPPLATLACEDNNKPDAIASLISLITK